MNCSIHLFVLNKNILAHYPVTEHSFPIISQLNVAVDKA
jgi:hypothetical protein